MEVAADERSGLLKKGLGRSQIGLVVAVIVANADCDDDGDQEEQISLQRHETGNTYSGRWLETMGDYRR